MISRLSLYAKELADQFYGKQMIGGGTELFAKLGFLADSPCGLGATFLDSIPTVKMGVMLPFCPASGRVGENSKDCIKKVSCRAKNSF